MQRIENDFGFGDVFEHWLFRTDEVKQAVDRPGLYAWFLRPPRDRANETDFGAFGRVFAERRFRVFTKAPLGERMDGLVDRRQAELRPFTPGEELEEDLFAQAFAVFSPPVYIGRSRNVRSRLRTHVRALEAELGRPPRDDEGTFERTVSDTDEESSQFGTRMGFLLRSRGITDSRGLFVKVVYAPSNTATKRVEYLLNRTFHPVLGRL